MITVKQAAALLGLTSQRVRALIKAGRLPSAVLVDTDRGPVWKLNPADLTQPAITARKDGRPRRTPPAATGTGGTEEGPTDG